MYKLTNVVYYDSDSKFKIYPTLCEVDNIQFNKFIQMLTDIYNKKYNKETFFWKYDGVDSIIINNYDFVAENKIYNQLRKLVMWLYKNNYRVDGQYYGRINSCIEYIKIDSDSQMINYHIMHDDKKNYFFGLSNSGELGSKIIINAKQKIDSSLVKYHQNYCVNNTKSSTVSKFNCLIRKSYFCIPVLACLISVSFIFWPIHSFCRLGLN